jgi:molybdenum cofactor cytidylyltransferase
MISAMVLAAGQSTRMGQPKMLLPWGQTTVIGQVVSTLFEAGLIDIHIVAGAYQAELKKAIKEKKVDFIINKDYGDGELLTSVQVGLRSLEKITGGVLIVLGDQPQIKSQVVKKIIDTYSASNHKIIVPSYQMHRGHPWLVDKSLWNVILDLTPPTTLHDFLNTHNNEIDYIVVDTPSVIQDLDTQDDYNRLKP